MRSAVQPSNVPIAFALEMLSKGPVTRKWEKLSGEFASQMGHAQHQVANLAGPVKVSGDWNYVPIAGPSGEAFRTAASGQAFRDSALPHAADEAAAYADSLFMNDGARGVSLVAPGQGRLTMYYGDASKPLDLQSDARFDARTVYFPVGRFATEPSLGGMPAPAADTVRSALALRAR